MRMGRTILVSAMALALASAAEAHPRLVSASPPVGGEVAAAPSAISITFSEALFIRLSSVELKDPRGHTVRTGPAALDPANDHRLVVPLTAPLRPGNYTVTWHAVSADTHRVQGVYRFTVG
jgi:copper resistance protein C